MACSTLASTFVFDANLQCGCSQASHIVPNAKENYRTSYEVVLQDLLTIPLASSLSPNQRLSGNYRVREQ